MDLVSVANAQKADSLEAALLSVKTDTAKAILLSQVADEWTKLNPEKAIERARQGLALAKQIRFEKGIFENSFSLAVAFQNQALFDSSILYLHQAKASAQRRKDIAGQAEICSSLGHSFMRKSNIDSARHYLNVGLNLAKQANDYRTEAGIYNNYGNVFLEETNYQQALDYFVKAAKLYENPLHDDYGQCLALSNIGNIEYRFGNYNKAINYAQQSMNIAKKRNFTSSIGYAHKLLGRIYKKQGKYDSALAEYNEGQKIYLQLGDPRSAAELLQNIGNVYFEKEKYREALNNYLQSLKLARRISSKTLTAYAYSCIGQAYTELKKNDDALSYLDSARLLAKEIGNRYLVMDSYSAMSAVYEAKGDYKKALSIHRQFALLKDSITQSENRQLAEETQAKYELEKKESKIALLEKDQELKALALGRQRAVQVGAAIALILVIIISVLLINRYRSLNEARRQAEIQQMRNTIARDLHDDIGSTLSSINIISKLALRENPSANSMHLNRIAEQSSRMMESMTDMVWSINPMNDSMEKVVVKMKVFASEILEAKNIGLHFIGEESIKGLTLSADKRKNLFLIFKEAVNNAAKYSNATQVKVAIESLNGYLTMIIDDNGKGFAEQNSVNGNGLKNMQTRAKAIQAYFNLLTNVGTGTRIELKMPIT
jgi:signal transduction histidine kinase